METEKRRFTLFISVILILLALQLVYQNTKPKTPSYYDVEVVEKYPHDPDAFTQGLVYYEGYLYEGTGLYGESSLRKVDFETGEVLKQIDLEDQYFGEGITILEDKVYQITWKEETGFVYNLDDFTIERTFRYQGQGWGLTHDGTHLIMSNGSSTLSFYDPSTFELMKTVDVIYDGAPVPDLNELEYIDGVVYSNVWNLDQIIIINPDDGSTHGWTDLESLRGELDSSEGVDVLNGIAYDAESGSLLLTGKFWPNLFEVELVPK